MVFFWGGIYARLFGGCEEAASLVGLALRLSRGGAQRVDSGLCLETVLNLGNQSEAQSGWRGDVGMGDLLNFLDFLRKTPAWTREGPVSQRGLRVRRDHLTC